MSTAKKATKEQVVLRLPVELHSWLKSKADEADRSFNYVAVQALRQAQAKEAV